ncbi:MAG: DUF4936 family protein [Caldimonas sp.]
MRELFIYYRVRSTDAAAARLAALAMHDALRGACPGLVARLLTRCDESRDGKTWMETYSLADRPGGMDAALQTAIEARAAAWAHLVDGPRHVEAFEAIADP